MARQRKNGASKGMHMSLEDIAQELGVTRQRVEQIEKRAIAKLKQEVYNRFGDSVTLADLLPTVMTGGTQNSLSRLRLPSE